MFNVLVVSMLVFTTAETLQDVDHLKTTTIHFPRSMFTLCPYFTDCDTNITHTPNVQDGYEPCCKQCSCKADCGIAKNCCRDEFDKRDGIPNEMCTLSAVPFSPRSPSYSVHYYMVQECSADTWSSKSCNDFKEASWGAMYPVTSPSKGQTFINQKCAQCNGVNDGMPWELSIMCQTLNEYPAHITVTEKIKDAFAYKNDCSIFFRPGDTISEIPRVCNPDIIRRCNVFSYIAKITDEMEELCQSFNAPYTHFVTSKNNVYGNVYCYLCTIPDDNPSTECPSEHDQKYTFAKNIFVSSILHGHIDKIFKSELGNTGNGIESTQNVCGFLGDMMDECRPAFCAEGQIWLSDRGCSFFSKAWYSERFNLYIKLTYVHDAKKKVRISCFSLQFRNNPRLNLIKLRVPGLAMWKKTLHFHPSSDFSYVDYFVVKLSLSHETIRPGEIIPEFAEALDKIWNMTACGETYKFNAQINEFTEYLDRKTMISPKDVHGKTVYVPMYLIYDQVYPSTSGILIGMSFNEYDEPLNVIQGVVLTESFFCRQTCLRQSEYIDYNDRLFVKKLDIYLEEGQYRRVRNADGHSEIKVCVEIEHRYTSREDNISCFMACLPLPIMVAFVIHYG